MHDGVYGGPLMAWGSLFKPPLTKGATGARCRIGSPPLPNCISLSSNPLPSSDHTRLSIAFIRACFLNFHLLTCCDPFLAFQLEIFRWMDQSDLWFFLILFRKLYMFLYGDDYARSKIYLFVVFLLESLISIFEFDV